MILLKLDFMPPRIQHWITVLAKEPPFRLLFKKLFSILPVSLRVKSYWCAGVRPHYLFGLVRTAYMAMDDEVEAFSVIEFGVGEGEGLLILDRYATLVERETGIKVKVFGFDTGKGLPKPCGDYRDQPNLWEPGEFPMLDEEGLREKLGPRTTLLIGDVAETVPSFIESQGYPPIGFVIFDLCYYSSTTHALRILSSPKRKILPNVILYFNNIEGPVHHRFAGELLAIEEFNAQNSWVKIDRWRGVSNLVAFHDMSWLESMFVAHDLEASTRPERERKGP
jgi:hypothetical protein